MGANQEEPQGPGMVLCYGADLNLVTFPESPGGYGGHGCKISGARKHDHIERALQRQRRTKDTHTETSEKGHSLASHGLALAGHLPVCRQSETAGSKAKVSVLPFLGLCWPQAPVLICRIRDQVQQTSRHAQHSLPRLGSSILTVCEHQLASAS